jgi:DNA-binding CsgD family transcriptional regulator
MEDPVEELERTWELCQRVAFCPDRARLQSGLLEPIACLLGAEMAILRVFVMDKPKPSLLVGLGVPDAVHDAYLNRYFKLDPVRGLVVERFGGPLFADQDRPGQWLDGRVKVLGERPHAAAAMAERYRANFHRYQREFLAPYNLRHHLGFCFQDPRGSRTFMLNFMRGRKSSAFKRLDFARGRIIGTLLHARVAQSDPRIFDHDAFIGATPFDRDAEIDQVGESDVLDRHLSAREVEVAQAVATGLTNKEIGAALSISVRTVENHMRSIFSKLDISTRTRLAAKPHELKLNSL